MTMINIKQYALTIGCVALMPAFAQAACEDLKALDLPHTEITIAASVPAGNFEAPDGKTYKVPDFCRVHGVARPSSDSNINWEVWLPTTDWSGRFYQAGNGGYAGAIHYFQLAGGVRAGNVIASTDSGHEAPAGESSWALNHPEKIVDFGYRSLVETTNSAKALIKAFYGAPAVRNYFVGCSNGGREAMVEATRFPGEWDGILVGAPAFWRQQLAASLWYVKAFSGVPGAAIPEAKLPAIQRAALASCKPEAHVIDGIATDPRHCPFNPETMICKDSDNNNCLTTPQAQALRLVYEGMRNPRTGEQLHYGQPPTLETGWKNITQAASSGSAWYKFAEDFFKNMVFDDPAWTFDKFDFDHDFEYAGSKELFGEPLEFILYSHKPSLRKFYNNGSKMIMYSGWGDLGATGDTLIHYYKKTAANVGGMENNRNFFRLFLVPGMGHCFGGTGVSNFGAFGQFFSEWAPGIPVKAVQDDAQHNIIRALEAWVEEGIAPDRIVAAEYVDNNPDKGTVMTRPICAYPKIAKYKGSGSKNDAANFACEDNPDPKRE